MSPKVYTSPFPSFPLVNRSVATHLLASDDPALVGRFPASSIAFIDSLSGTALTRAKLKHLALTFGHGLLHHPSMSLKRGDTVLIFAYNSLAWPVVVYGAIAAGLRCTLANDNYTSRELAHQFKDSNAKFIITTQEGVPVVRQMLASLNLDPNDSDKKIMILSKCLLWAGGPAGPRGWGNLLTFEDLLQTGTLPQEEKFEGEQAHETVYLCYSSGTTGNPKGVETTHRNITTVLDGVARSFEPLDPRHDAMLAFLPFYHMYGAVKLLMYPFYSGIPTIIQRRFEPTEFCRNVEKYKITITFVAPPVLVTLARHPAVDAHDLTSLRIMLSGAAPLGSDLVKQLIGRLLALSPKHKKLAIVQGYGLSETSPTSHMLPPKDAMRKIGSIGPLLASLQARLVVDDDGAVDAAEGQPGEIWLKGASIMKGYINNVAATKHAITPDGWFKTGDIAIRDSEGFYYIVDRKKELIKYKGFQVPPAELESVLLTHPQVADAAVIGVYDAKEATELPRAYIVHANADVVKTEQAKEKFALEVQKWIEGKVAKHKYLRGGVVVIDVVPKSPAGKILRKNLRERAKKETIGAKL